jgi:hypothetical protein
MHQLLAGSGKTAGESSCKHSVFSFWSRNIPSGTLRTEQSSTLMIVTSQSYRSYIYITGEIIQLSMKREIQNFE